MTFEYDAEKLASMDCRDLKAARGYALGFQTGASIRGEDTDLIKQRLALMNNVIDTKC